MTKPLSHCQQRIHVFVTALSLSLTQILYFAGGKYAAWLLRFSSASLSLSRKNRQHWRWRRWTDTSLTTRKVQPALDSRLPSPKAVAVAAEWMDGQLVTETPETTVVVVVWGGEEGDVPARLHDAESLTCHAFVFNVLHSRLCSPFLKASIETTRCTN